MNRKEFDMGEDRKEAQFRKMTGEKIPGLILSLAVPTIISMIVTAIYNTADTYFVSKLGTSASGAVGIVMSLMGLIQSLGFMIGMGSGSWMSRLLGEKKDETASKVAASGFYFSLHVYVGMCRIFAGTWLAGCRDGMLLSGSAGRSARRDGDNPALCA